MMQGVWWIASRPSQADEGYGEGDRSYSQSCFRSHFGQADSQRGCAGKVPSPSRKRLVIDHVVEALCVSERRACRVVGQHRSTQRRLASPRSDEVALTADIICLAEQYSRDGYRRMTALLREYDCTDGCNTA